MTSNPRLIPAAATDEAERTKVLDATRSFIVQAPAGSGKTELLMQRYLTLLSHESVTSPESVLAITFTRKAAAEMRNRVLGALESADGPAPAEVHKRISWELAGQVLKRDRELAWNLLQNPERLEIRTVDSFCEKIARRTPLLAGLGQSPAIASDFQPLYREAAQRTLLMLGDEDVENREAIAQILRDQDNSFDRVQGLFVELLARRDQWGRLIGGSLRRTAAEQDGIRARLERALADAVGYELGQVRRTIESLISPDRIAQLIASARYAAENVEADHEIRALRDLRALPPASGDALPVWIGLAELCLTQKSNFRAQINKNQGFPLAGREKKTCSELLEHLAGHARTEELCAAFSRIRKLPPPRYEDGQWQSLLALFRLLPLSVAHLRTVFAERGEVDYTEIALAAKAALGEDGHPTDLGLHLGYKIQHLLVDEFQDTSLAQAELLERLIQAWSPEMSATLFVVGDPMQSIYGFRQAEVTLFSRARERGFGNGLWPLDPAQLQANFRSRPELVTWFNRVFPQILREDNDVTGGVRYAPATAARAPSGSPAVFLRSAPFRDYEAESAEVLDAVREELATDAKTIAILVRARKHVVHIAPALRDAGIPFRSKDIDVLGERQTVRDLHAITRAILHLGDRTAWLALLRGPWCGLSLADLWTLCRNGRQHTVWELMQARRGELSPQGQASLDRIYPVLAAAVEQRMRTSLRGLTESVWVSLGGPATLSGRERDAKLRDVSTYLDLLERLESFGEVDEAQLETEIARLYTQPDTSPDIRVELMTIHGAKGLEFDVVIVPGLNRSTENNRIQLLNWRERVIGDQRDLLLSPMEPVGARPDDATTITRYINQLGNECNAEETKRLLYVAATRAKERLYLVTTMPDEAKPPLRGSMLSFFPPEILAEFPTPPEPEELPIPERKPNVFHRLPADWRIPDPPAPIAVEPRHLLPEPEIEPRHTYERVGPNLRRIGTVTHRLLQQIGQEGAETWSDERIEKLSTTIRTLLVQQGIPPADLSHAQSLVARALRNTLNDASGKWILQLRPTAQNEYGLTSMLEPQRRSIKVDRTFVEDGTRWLIDYKTSDKEGTITDAYIQEQVNKYQADLDRYAKILKAHDGLPVRGGLYFPLMQIWREVEIAS